MKKLEINIITIIILLFSLNLYGQVWFQQGGTLYGTEALDMFGSDVSLSADGQTLVVGSPGKEGSGTHRGQVRVFRLSANNWIQLGQSLDGTADFDRFGTSVCINSDGSIIAIGAICEDFLSDYSDTGYVKIFRLDQDVWTQIGSTIFGDAKGDRFGASICLDSTGNIIAISAPLNNGSGNQRGRVKVFSNQADSWNQVGLNLDGEIDYVFFGEYLSLSGNGNTLAVGEVNEDWQLTVYNYESGNWNQLGGRIQVTDQSEWISSTISSDGSVVALGIPAEAKVKLFRYNGSWNAYGQDIVNDDVEGRFGHSLSLNTDGSILAVGAPRGNNEWGEVKIFQNSSDNWLQCGSTIQGTQYDCSFGGSVSLSASGYKFTSGASYFHGLNHDQYALGQAVVYIYGVNSIASNEVSSNELQLFPNPVIDRLYINNVPNKSEIEIYDNRGELVYKNYISQPISMININHLVKGVYLLKVQSSNRCVSKKFIIN